MYLTFMGNNPHLQLTMVFTAYVLFVSHRSHRFIFTTQFRRNV